MIGVFWDFLYFLICFLNQIYLALSEERGPSLIIFMRVIMGFFAWKRRSLVKLLILVAKYRGMNTKRFNSQRWID